MTVGQMKDFLKDLNEDLEILVKIPGPTKEDWSLGTIRWHEYKSWNPSRPASEG